MKNLRSRLTSLYQPEQYHGWGKTKQYFEGWYYKIINREEDKAFAIIPGIAMDADGNRHAFIQVMDGKQNTSLYIKFQESEFNPDRTHFNLSIANNQFAVDQISLELAGFQGNLKFSNQVPWPVKWNSPGIMGPYAFVPFMECYHGILSMDHDISGEIMVNGERIDFTGGRGYIEKDWGLSFPSAYIWMQSNHFSEKGTSLKLSVANIPWLRSSFVGFIAGFWWQNELIQFTTYNSSKLLRSNADENEVSIELQSKKFILKVEVQRTESTELASPILGFMDGRINESMTAEILVTLLDKKSGEILFKDTGHNAGLEVAGELHQILI
jgi:hypothetical protein